MKTRMVETWGDGAWTEYFFGQYLEQYDVQGEMRYTASWHAGMAARLRPGHPASQQTAEQCFRKLKRSLAGRPVRTHVDLADAVMRSVEIWASPLKQGEADQDRGLLSLMADEPHGSSLSSPSSPDSWMLGSEGRALRRPGGFQQYRATIPTVAAFLPFQCVSAPPVHA